MTHETRIQLSDRREFLGKLGKSAALASLATAAAAKRAAAATALPTNPFAYDLTRLEKTDPALIKYKEVARWRSPRKEVKRLAIGPDDRL